MSFEKFKNEIKEKSVKELLEYYRKINQEISLNNSLGSTHYSLLTHGVFGPKGNLINSPRMKNNKLKKQRAIVLTKLNRLGWNGEELNK